MTNGVDNTDYEASLILRKIYEVLPDEKAAGDDLLRVASRLFVLMANRSI
jgi:hypothetical protein